MSAIKANPLPENGVVGLLTHDQTAALKQFYQQLFELLDNSPRQASTDPSSAQPDASISGDPNAPPKGSGSSSSKDDAAKEAQRKNEEMANARLAFQQYGSERFEKTFWRFVAMDHPDSICLKFLRARKWNPTAGVAMFASCMKWRIESGVEDIFTKGEEGLKDGEGFLLQMTSGKCYLHGSDRHERPVLYVHAGMHKTNEQSPQALENFVMFQMESLRCLAHDTVDKVTLCFDLSNFGLSNMDWRVVNFITKCLESYYPESLNAILVHKAPWVFHGIWKILAPMLDPVVRAKVQLTKTAEDLCIHIPPAHLPQKLGGDNTWQYKYPEIVPGENKIMQDATTRDELQRERDSMAAEFVALTRKWAQSDDRQLDSERDLLAKRLRTHYFVLDPYIRGRSSYHRSGVIVGNGLVTFRYPGAHGLPEGEYEVLGHKGSKETLDLEIERKLGKAAGKPALKRPATVPASDAAPSTPKKVPEIQTEGKQPDGLPSTSSSILSIPPSYASTPGRSASYTSQASSPSISASESSRAPFRNTIPTQAEGVASTPTSDKQLGTPSSANSNTSTRSKLSRRFSSSASLILRVKGDKRSINKQDGSVAV